MRSRPRTQPSPSPAARGPRGRVAAWLLAGAVLVGPASVRPGTACAEDDGEAPAPPGSVEPAVPRRRPPSVRAAEKVLGAFRAEDAAALAEIAATTSSDPWAVAHVLCGWSEFDAAAAFAAGLKGTDTAALPAFVASRRGKPDDAASREASFVGEEVLAAKDWVRALAVYEPARASPDPILASYGSRGVALALEGMGRREEAFPVYIEAAERAESIGWLRRSAAVLADAADCAEDIGAPHLALPLRERIVVVQTRRGAERSLASALWNVGFAYGTFSQHDRALRYFERSREVLISVGSVWGEARMLQAEGECLRSLGRPTEAWARLERAIALFDKAGSLRTRGRCRTTAAHTLLALGRRDEAMAMLETGASQYIAGGDADGACKAYFVLADLAAADGDMAAMAGLLDRIERTAGEKASLDTQGGVLIRRAIALRRAGDTSAAVEAAAGAVEFFVRARKRSRVRSAMETARGILAEGDAAGLALPFHQRILALAELRGNSRVEVDALGGVAAAHVAAGRDADAIAAARRAVERMEDLPSAVGEEQWAGLRCEFPQVLGAGMVAATRAGDAAALLALLEAGRATALIDSMRTLRDVSPEDVPPDLRREDAGAAAAEAECVANLRRAIDAGDGEKADEARAALEQARADRRDILERIQRRVAATARTPGAAAPAALDGIRARLGADEAFVSYGFSTMKDLDHAVALVVTKDGARIVPLGKGSDVVRACDALAAADPAQDAPVLAAALRTLVGDPLSLGAKFTRVTVSPDGALAYAPLAFLFPGRDVVYVPSAAAHGILAGRTSGAAGSAPILALGDPDYAPAPGDAAVAPLRSGVVLSRLPASGDEARAVGDVVLTRGAATEAGLRTALTSQNHWRAVHFACHGSVDERNMLFSALALTRSAGDDGFLTALEVHRLRVPADLVTLSACETGRGRLYPGEGSAGLAQAFMVAGAPRVLVSLWKVDDAATAVLMKRFYEAFRKGVPAARALREAQESVRSEERWRHPRFWASWTLWGDGG